MKPLLAEVHSAALNRTKAEGNPCLDLLARVAIIKFLRIELGSQFAQILERCRMMLKSYEGVRQQKALEYRERVGAFQVAKKIILRKTGQELFRTLREIEKETLARTRRSLFGNSNDDQYKLFLNPLIFTVGRLRRLCQRRAVCDAGQFRPRSRPLRERSPDRLRVPAIAESRAWRPIRSAPSMPGSMCRRMPRN